MQNLQFPIKFHFKISTLANDFTAKDANGKIVAFVSQKMFRLKEDISIYSDESRSKEIYKLKADTWLDFSAAYSMLDENSKEFGKVVRKGWRTIWKANYDLLDQFNNRIYTIREENVWVKVMDSIFGGIPIIGMFTGYIFNPSYVVMNKQDKIMVRLSKMPSFFGRKFEINKLGNVDNEDDDRIMLGLMMMILLERRRG